MLRAKLRLTRSNQVTEMLRTSVRACAIAIFVMIGVASCDRKSGEAVVIGKEHIDAALLTEGTPNAKSEPSSNAQIRAMADDEITVDGYVMKTGVRGTSRDPRALSHEQWIVKVRMLDNGRTIQVPADQAQWEKLRENDRVKVRYRRGKYTGTVWAAEIE
ncbi:MAG: hypothetical protein DMF31_04995 [Verrucomicrobia bacterium]|nr:MAG: hypothetical protein DMF31_04995 [Verrucomicrobiota bacterium]